MLQLQSSGIANMLFWAVMHDYPVDKKEVREFVRKVVSLHRRGEIEPDALHFAVRLAMEREISEGLERKIERTSRKSSLFR